MDSQTLALHWAIIKNFRYLKWSGRVSLCWVLIYTHNSRTNRAVFSQTLRFLMNLFFFFLGVQFKRIQRHLRVEPEKLKINFEVSSSCVSLTCFLDKSTLTSSFFIFLFWYTPSTRLKFNKREDCRLFSL